MAVSSTHSKDCPTCRSTVDIAILRCDCGYRFAAVADDGESPINLLAEAEVLYETHLRARLRRARHGLKLTKIDVLRNPGNAACLSQLHQVEKEVEALKAQIDKQSELVAKIRAAAVPTVFRAAQSVKAVRSLETAQHLQTLAIADTHEIFTMVQGERAREVVQQSNRAQHCPACGIDVVASAARCGCGHTFTANDATADFISIEEIAALRNS